MLLFLSYCDGGSIRTQGDGTGRSISISHKGKNDPWMCRSYQPLYPKGLVIVGDFLITCINLINLIYEELSRAHTQFFQNP